MSVDPAADVASEFEAVSPSVQRASINYGPVRELAAELHGRGATRRYPAPLVEPILDQQAGAIAYQIYVGSEPGQLLTCYRLDECPSHAVLQISVGSPSGVSNAFALPTLLEASYYLLDRVAEALASETPLDVMTLDERVLDLVADTAPPDVEPTINRLFETVTDDVSERER